MTDIIRTPAIRLAWLDPATSRIDPWRFATLIGISLMGVGETFCVAKVVGSMIWR